MAASSCLIIGESGTGKSRSIKNLDPKKTVLINVIGKPLPVAGYKKAYVPMTKENPKGNLLVSDNWETINKTIEHIDKNRPEIKTIVIDDFQYIMTNEFMRRHSAAGKGNGVFQLYNEIGDHTWQILWNAINLGRDDLTIIVLAHSQTTDDGKTKIKTIGKMLDDKVVLEGMFLTVLNTSVEDGKYYFDTQNNGNNTTKSPEGMFTESRIENDLQLVIEAINKYNKGE